MGAGTPLRSFQESGGFEAAFRRYRHERLRMASAFVAIVATALLGTSVASYFASGASTTESLLSASRCTLLGATLGIAALHLGIRRIRPTAAALVVADAMQTGYLLLVATTFYAVDYESGPVLLVPILGLMLVARAVFVPCRALRTFLCSAPAMPAVLAVELWHGTMYSLDAAPVSHGSYVAHVIWEQVYLLLSIGLATLASRVNFSLRLKAYEADAVGQYELVERLGTGGMGEVWKAQHALLRRPTAIKIIRADVADERTRLRFEEEVRQTCRLTHPNVIAIYDYGHTADGVFFYAMELLEGVDLSRAVVETGPMPAARVIHVLSQACSGLAEAHARGLVHRDVKAANLFLCERGLESDVVKVMDFGLVKDTAVDLGASRAGEVCGTPETMAPETIRGRPAAPPVDIYALGAVGCYLLTGRPIFDVGSALEFVSCHLTQAPVPPSQRGISVPPDLEETLLACLRKDPGERVGSAAELRRRLLQCADAGRWTPDDAAAWWRDWHSSKAAASASPSAQGVA